MLAHALSLFYEPNQYIDTSWHNAFQMADNWPTRLKNAWLVKHLYSPPLGSAEEWLNTLTLLPVADWYDIKAIIYLAGAYCLKASIIAQGSSIRLAYQARQFLYMPIGNVLPKVYFPFLSRSPQLRWPNKVDDRLIFQTGLCYFFKTAVDIKKIGIHWFQRFVFLLPYPIFSEFFEAHSKVDDACKKKNLNVSEPVATNASSSDSFSSECRHWQASYMQKLYIEMIHWVNQYSKPFNDTLLLSCAKTYAQTISRSR